MQKGIISFRNDFSPKTVGLVVLSRGRKKKQKIVILKVES